MFRHMLINKIFAGLILAICAYPAIAQISLAEELAASPHYKLAPSTPQRAAIAEWHGTVVNDNFRAYRELAVGASVLSISGAETNEMLKSRFIEIRNSTPDKIMVTEPFQMPSGNYLVHASGCKRGLIHTVLLSLAFSGKRWRVLDGIWYPDDKKTTCSE